MENLINHALQARQFSYSPYSGFHVGAALESVDGRIFTGCNIENAAYSPSNCAERTAFFKAVSEGAGSFRRIVIVGGYEDMPEQFCAPCGVCRQVMREFCEGDFEIILAKSPAEYRKYTLDELLPESFGPVNLR